MKKISIFIVILFISLGGKAQEANIRDTIIQIYKDSIVGTGYEYKFEDQNIIEQVIRIPQSDIYLDRIKIVSINRDTIGSIITFKFQNIGSQISDRIKELLRKGCYLKNKNESVAHVSFNVVDANAKPNNGDSAASEEPTSEDSDVDKEKSETTAQPDLISLVTEMKEEISSIQNELKITQYAAIITGVILLILTIVLSKYKVKGGFIENSNNKIATVDNSLERTEGEIDKDINNKIESLEEAIKGIKTELKTELEKIKALPVSNESNGSPVVQRANPEPMRKPEEKVVSPIGAPSIGYVDLFKDGGIFDKDIKSECDEYCVYKMEISTHKARYFINEDPKVLNTIIRQLYMFENNYYDETNGQQATKVETVECGTLQRDASGHWKVDKPMKFTIK